MKARFTRVIAGFMALLLVLPTAAFPQAVQPATAPAQNAPAYTPEQLDQLLAPIALYPDALLGQILMASTYPLEVVEAARWLQDPHNAALRGDQLAAALEQQDWDPSVKALVPFPQIVAMMNERLDWMQKLGDAFLAQQGDVMDSVQRLRRQAQAAGNLQSTPQQTVETQDQEIVVVPANPQVVYVPVYNPVVVYGAWPYPAYPPVYIPPPPGYVVGAAVIDGIGFSIGFTIVRTLWGWDDCDWRDRRIHIDPARVNIINNYYITHYDRPRVTVNTWEHDPYHRRGVAYRDPHVRQEYQRAMPGSPDARRAYRGYEPQNAPLPASAPRTAPAPQRQGAPLREQHVEQHSAPQQHAVPQQHAAVPQQRAAPGHAVQAQTRAMPSRAYTQPSTAFQRSSPGSQARTDAARGRESRASAPARVQPRAAPAHAAPAHAAPAPAHAAPQAAPAHSAPPPSAPAQGGSGPQGGGAPRR